MSNEREYIIILKNFEDSDQFYEDMESHYGDTEIPDRIVECAERRPLSRSTHYWLTDEEADQVSRDSRVESVTLTYQERGLAIRSLVTNEQTSSNWDKSGTNGTNDLNWKLLRGYEGQARASWGSDATAAVTGTINLTNTGNNVDVVIIDGHLVLDHPEWASNADGSGTTRLNRFNWFQYNPQVAGTSAGTYVYDFAAGGDADNNHGNNVGSIAVGSSQGWARSANIYNISPYSTTANNTGNYIYNLLNYIRVWHANKAINPVTGRKNPTICNMSFGFNGGLTLSTIDSIRYQGVSYNRPAGGWSNDDRAYFGLVAASGTTMLFMTRDASFDADVADCINDGIILVGAAGNFYMYNDRLGGTNYDNYLRVGATDYYYQRGPTPGASTGVISVSAVDSTAAERKVDFSNTGPRTDILAGGTNIMGAYYTGGIADPRNASFQKGKMSGTSQASPQVAGLLACALEVYPAMTPAEALAYIRFYANKDVLSGGTATSLTYPTFDYLNYNNLNNAPNLYAIYKSERRLTSLVFPKNDFKIRPSSGRVFPRQKIRRYG